MPSGTKSKEIEEIARASMAHVAVDVISTTDAMVILRAGGDHKVTPLFEVQLTILSNKGHFSPFNKLRQMRWK